MGIKYVARSGQAALVDGYTIPSTGLVSGFPVSVLDAYCQDVLGSDSPLIKSSVETLAEGAPANYDTLSELAAGKLDASKLVKYSSAASAGGAASEPLVVTGLGASDSILSVSQKVAGANGLAMVGYSAQIADGLTVAWTADPGAGAIVEVLVLKA